MFQAFSIHFFLSSDPNTQKEGTFLFPIEKVKQC